jgi:hypothetical protein
MLLISAALILGFSTENLLENQTEANLRRATAHRLMGTAAALSVVFVESLVVTYFIGTSRWCREVVETYQLAPPLIQTSNQLKRRAFPVAVVGMLVIILVGALGAAADPATGRAGTENLTVYHLASALAGIAVIAWTFFHGWQSVVANQRLINQVTDAVACERKRRGLDANGSTAVDAHVRL